MSNFVVNENMVSTKKNAAHRTRATPMSEMLYTRKMELRVNPISAAYT